MFTIADACVVNKIDLVPYINFNTESFAKTVTGMNPDIEMFKVSGVTKDGLNDWIDWVMKKLGEYRE
jgi:hydrogenase nickel incorporation protein HypB